MEGHISTILFGTFVGLMVLGTPISVALGMAALVTFFILDTNPIVLVQIAFNSVGSFPLMALPSFILAGALMEAAGISKRLVNVAESLAGAITGGMAISTVFACVLFGSISGSGPATTAAVGMLMIPAMIKAGYKKGFAAAVTATSGGLGIIIPPSIPMVIFGISAFGVAVPEEAITKYGEFRSMSISTLFIAGFIPGMFLSVSLMVLSYFTCKRRGFTPTSDSWSFSVTMTAFKKGFWSILAPVIILGGIYSGFFTPTESAIVAIFYTLFIGIFVHREIKFKDILNSLETTTWLSGRVLLVLFTATAFGRILVEQGITEQMADFVLGLTDNRYIIMLLVIVLLLFIGMFMETLSAIMILTPVLLPIAYNLGIDPIHFGIIVICTLSIGFATPPLGENLFVASAITDISFERIAMRALPFIAVAIIAVIIIAFVPQLSLMLPNFLSK
ncbi:MAG: TRAP transporter large permease [Ostreibacterium sp.]